MMLEPVYRYVAKPTNIVDGDTIDLEVSLGLRVSTKDRFRLYGINTPERGQAGWAEATRRLRELCPVSVPLIVDTQRDTKDKYGRWLAILYIDDTGKSVNDMLVEEGHAVYKEY